MDLGRLREAVLVYERKNELYEKISTGYQNLAELYAQLGALRASVEAAHQALDLARKADDKKGLRISMCFQVQAEHMIGNLEIAEKLFKEAEIIDHEIYPQNRYLFSRRGILHADFLRRTGDLDYARRVTEANLQNRERRHLVN
jgi:tetratricopeptide (TPR) repeat protein